MLFQKQSFFKLNQWKFFPVVLVVLCCLYLMSQPVWAVNYTVFGQAAAVTSKDAADQKILVADLRCMGLPYMRVSAFNRGTGELLGSTDTGKNGQYTIKFTAPAAINIDLRVYNTINGGSSQFAEARTGINYIDSIGTYVQKKVIVISDEFWVYGDAGFCNIPGVGILFTSVGLVEIPYINQNPAQSTAGLADFPAVVGVPGIKDGVARAAELGISPFAKAPFSGRLLIFGDFGLPSITSCPLAKIDYYRVTITKHGTTDSFILMDPLSKTKTVVQTMPVLKVTNTTEALGPFNGTTFGGTTVDGLYQVNKNSAGAISSTFYSFPDLRLNWNTGSLNGLYEITFQYYQKIGGSTASPVVQAINSSCFVTTPPSGTLNGALHKLVLRVNNDPLTVQFNHIYLKNKINGTYFQGEGVVPSDGPIGSAYDYNGVGLCDIIALKNKYKIEINFTAHHAGGFMKNYSLNATNNSGTQTINFTDQNFGTLVTWPGTSIIGTAVVNPVAFAADCGYLFTLSAWSRLQNGYNYIQWAQPWRTYYVRPIL